MHRTALFLILAALLAGPASRTAAAADDVEIVRVWTGYRDAKSFVRISEYFTGRENTGRMQVLRTQPAERAGFYFTVRVKAGAREQLRGGRIALQVVAPDAGAPRTYSFPLAAETSRSLRAEIGLTGTDWTAGNAQPLAWKLEVFGATGELLASRQSYLWDRPRAAGT